MRLLPVLKPAEWEGPSRGARAHLWIGTSKEPQVYVGYAWESKDGLTYVTHESDENNDADEVVRQAFANLDEYGADFELVEAIGARLLVSAGRPFAAEQVLSEVYMMEVHEALEAETIVASVSRRGSMLACALECPDEAKNTMVNLHREAWLTADDDQRITNQLVVFSEGVKTVTMAVSDDGTVNDWT